MVNLKDGEGWGGEEKREREERERERERYWKKRGRGERGRDYILSHQARSSIEITINAIKQKINYKILENSPNVYKLKKYSSKYSWVK